MKKKATEIGVNESSGAEKVENIAKKESKKPSTSAKKSVDGQKRTVARKERATGDAALGDSVQERSGQEKASETSGKAERESRAAKARVEQALQKKEAQEKRKEQRKKRAEARAEKRKKRLEQRKAAAEKRKEEQKARAAQKQADREEKQRERAHAKANKHRANARKKKQKRAQGQDGEKESRGKGYGGWIAAVVTLGAVTLALATTVTVGAVDMKRSADERMHTNKATMYELTGIMEHVDDDLDRVRISNDSAQQGRILTDLLVQARLAEADLERLPIAAEEDGNVTSFINRIAMTSERLLGKLRRGETLSEEDKAALEELYARNHAVRSELQNEFSNLTDKAIAEYVKKGEGTASDVLRRLEELTLDENRAALDGEHAPKVQPNDPQDARRITTEEATELCRNYFSDYDIEGYSVVGETYGRGYAAYNVQGSDADGKLLLAEVDKRDGALLRFDYFAECDGNTFDIENAERIAEEFMQKLGYTDMTAVRLRENGSTVDFTYVYAQDGTVYYPDEIRVKVCRTRGVVSGMDSTRYRQNHKDRYAVAPQIDLSTAREKLSEKLEVEAVRLAVTATPSGERETYEFFCAYGEDRYFVYVDANTGAEIAIVNAENLQ